ncbi:MAG: sigma 54-interacting transcriptional regulator, partial [Candidatus Aminicenantaceae bacterium]
MTHIGDIQEEILLKSVLDTVSDGVTIIDPDLRVVFHNEAIRKMFGDITGKLCYEAYRGRVEPCVDCAILKVLKDGKQRKILSDTVGPNGQVMWMECVSGPLKDKHGNIIGAVEIVRDETEQMRLSKEYTTIKREMERQARFENIITQSKTMKSIFGLIEKIAPTNSTVLITGESGTGKELIARAIHANSDRKDEPFVSVNCAAIPENLLESELFGHVKGAFTGATRNHPGIICTAHEGTLFLDEVGEIPLTLQSKLLRFLQDGTCRRVGDTQTMKYDVRIVGATNRDLEEAVRDGVFREDLFFRLNVIPIYLPPLRERREDIVPIANHVLHKMCDAHSRQVTGISSKTLKKFLDYPWPGNIREMENVIEYALHLAEDNHTIEDEHLPPKMLNKSAQEWPRTDLVSIEEFIKRSIIALQSEHTEEQIAEILGISRKNLWEKRKRWGLSRPISISGASKA